MAIKDVETKCWILALFIRDDGERFLLGSGAYEFKDSQQHFAANTMSNDVVEVQGNDGYLLAGQVRRPSVQSFDGYVGDSSTSKPVVEGLRRDFFAFFRKNHFYKVIYVFPDGSAIQRKRGFLVDAPEVKEIYQIYPEYHVALNFEDVNYYYYNENAEGEEIYGKSAMIGLSMATGGLVWDADGAVTEGLTYTGVVTVSGVDLTINNEMSIPAPIADFVMRGNTYQQTYSGANLYNYQDTTGTIDSHITVANDGFITVTYDNSSGASSVNLNYFTNNLNLTENTLYAIVAEIKTVSGSGNLALCSGASAASQMTSNRRYDFSTFRNGDIFIATDRSKASFAGTNAGLRSYVGFSAGQSGSVTFRISVLADTSVTPETFVYQPYVGGIPSPNPDYPQEVQVVTGEQTVTTYQKNMIDSKNLSRRFYGYFESVGSLITAQDDRANNLVFWAPCKPNTAYSIRLPASALNAPFGNGKKVGFFERQPDIGVEVIKGGGNLSSTTSTYENFVSPENGHYIAVRIQASSIRLYEDLIAEALQVEEGTICTAFDGAHNNFYEINLGKNLFDKNTAPIKAGYFSGAGVIINPAGDIDDLTTSADRFTYILCKPNTTYTITKPNQQTNTLNRFRIGTASTILSLNDKLDDFVLFPDGSPVVSRAIKTGENAHYLYLYFGKATTATDPGGEIQDVLDGIQIEEGPSATDYAPYFTPIELCKIGDYQDYIYKSGNDWYVHKEIGKVTLNGSNDEDWAISNSGTSSFFYRYRAILNASTTNREIVVNIASQASPDLSSSNTNVGATLVATLDLRIRYGTETTLASWRSLLSDNNMICYYILATSTDTQITNQALIDQLEAVGAARLFVGENNITTTVASGTLQPELGIGYYTGVEDGYGFVWEEGRQPSDIVTVDSVDRVYPLLTITGETVNPVITNVTTGTILRYNGTITASQTLVIDMMNQTATLNGVSVLGNITGDWIYFNPGNNRVTYTANNATAPDATIEWQEIVG